MQTNFMILDRLKDQTNIASIEAKYGKAGAIVYATRRYVHGESNLKALNEARKLKKYGTL